MKQTLLLLAFCCLFLETFAQTKVKGLIKDQNGKPIAGATIKEKGTNRATSSDSEGSFEIEINAENRNLIILALGYQTADITAAQVSAGITLLPANSDLEEVIVVGFGTTIKKDLTGNIARIKGEDIEGMPVSNLTSTLQGRAAGVQVEANSGKVGEGVKVRVRGSGSLSASNSPLYVVDGIPIADEGISSNALTDINFNDIESFEILKDASASAIYGSRAANGVVLITTKKGKSGKTKFNFNSQYGKNSATGHRKFLNAAQYVELIRESAINSDNIDGIDPLDPSQYEDSWLEYVEERLDRYSGWSDWRNLETDTDWESLAFNKDAQTKTMDLNASGGNENTRFYASGSYTDQDGILINNFFKRFSGRLNLDHSISERLKIGLNLGLSKTNVNRVADDNAFSTPLQLVALAPITPTHDLDGNLYNTPTTSYYNGLLEINEVARGTESFRNLGNAFLDYNIIDHLKFRSEFGVDIQNQTMNYWASPLSETGTGINGYAESEWFKAINYNTNNYFNYSNIFAGKHTFDATLGMSYQEYNDEYIYVQGQDFPARQLRRLESAGEITDGSTSANRYNYLSYFARANYKFNDRYLFSVSGRFDGSSKFGTDNRYGFFPAVSGGWILSEEGFWKDNATVNFFKIRGSWGLTGNADGFGNFAHLGLFNGSKYNNGSVLITTQLANPQLKWEKSDQVDIGIDFGLFDSRLSGEIDYYVRNTNDLIYDVPVPGTSGFATQTVNVGSMQNKGVELVLNSTNISNLNFKWTTSFNIAYNKNKITKLDGNSDLIPGNDGRFLNSLIVGESIGIFYGPEYAGVDPENGDALFYKEDRTTTNDMREAGNFIVGDPNPDFIGGLTNTFTYKDFDLSFLLQGVFGNQITNGAGAFMSSSMDWFDNQTVDQLRRWQNPGDITDMPQVRFNYGNSSNASSRHVEDGDYLRLKNITFGYKLPAIALERLHISSARIFLSGVNLLTFTKYTGWDPEVNADYRSTNRNQGADFYSAPQIKTWTVGLNIGF